MKLLSPALISAKQLNQGPCHCFLNCLHRCVVVQNVDFTLRPLGKERVQCWFRFQGMEDDPRKVSKKTVRARQSVGAGLTKKYWTEILRY